MQTHNSQVIFFIIATTAIVFFLAVIIVTLLYIYQKRQLAYNRKVDAMKLDFEKSLLRTQIEIQEETFQSISREIHDNVSLSLTLVKLSLNTLDWSKKETTQHSIQSSVNILGSAITDLSHLSRSMNTELIRDMGLMRALKTEVAKLSEMAHLQIKYEIKGEPIFMDSEKEIIVFRIIQEAFNNIIKHSNADKVWLYIDYSLHFLDILIKDNGIGFEQNNSSDAKNRLCAGLTNMHSRAKLFGGRLTLQTMPNRGTQILVTVPYY